MLDTNNNDNIILGGRYLTELYDEIKQVYLSDKRPWVIGYSGGKDSTATLQLVWNALNILPKEKLHKPIYIISSDTLVETPVVIDHINSSIKELQHTSEELKLPFHAQKVKPEINDTFWVNLIGRGYPIPYSRSRWCTDRLKIKPANKFILDKVTQYGEVLLLLGVRKAESATRAQVINLRTIKGTHFKRHSSLPGAFVYTPIVDFTLKDVWDFLLKVPSAWSKLNNNQYLFDLYKNANSAECPLVIDNTTPSCGNSRFGCWVCTVVKKDNSMESLIESGEDWLKPLLRFRNILSSLTNPKLKPYFRDHRRRDGKVYYKNFGENDSDELAWGQTTINKWDQEDKIGKELSIKGKQILTDMGLEVNDTDKGLPQVLFRELLKVHNELQKVDSTISIIGEEEIHLIRKLWKTEQRDWLDLVPAIYYEVNGDNLDWVQDDFGIYDSQHREMLVRLCNKQNVSFELVAELIEMEKQFYGMSRRTNINDKIDKIFNKNWNSLADFNN